MEAFPTAKWTRCGLWKVASAGALYRFKAKNLNSLSAVVSKFDYGYDAQGQITSWTQQTDTNDPQNWAMGYDNEGKLLNVNVTDTVTNSVLHQYAYLYDAAGNWAEHSIAVPLSSSGCTTAFQNPIR